MVLALLENYHPPSTSRECSRCQNWITRLRQQGMFYTLWEHASREHLTATEQRRRKRLQVQDTATHCDRYRQTLRQISPHTATVIAIHTLFAHSNSHLFLLVLALKFAWTLQSGSKPKSAFKVPLFSFNGSMNRISKSMKHKGFSLSQLRVPNKMSSVRHVVYVFYTWAVEPATNFFFFEFSWVNWLTRYDWGCIRIVQIRYAAGASTDFKHRKKLWCLFQIFKLISFNQRFFCQAIIAKTCFQGALWNKIYKVLTKKKSSQEITFLRKKRPTLAIGYSYLTQ